MKAALEQAQALYGNVPGFEGTDLMKMHEKLMQDSAEMFPGVAEAQAYQAKMMAESAQDPEAIMETYSKNIEFAGNMMQDSCRKVYRISRTVLTYMQVGKSPARATTA